MCKDNMNVQIYKLANIIKKAIPGSKIFKDEKINEQRNYIVSGRKIRQKLNFGISITLFDGVLEMKEEIFKNKKYEDYRNSKYTSYLKLS